MISVTISWLSYTESFSNEGFHGFHGFHVNLVLIMLRCKLLYCLNLQFRIDFVFMMSELKLGHCQFIILNFSILIGLVWYYTVLFMFYFVFVFAMLLVCTRFCCSWLKFCSFVSVFISVCMVRSSDNLHGCTRT